MIQRQIHRHKHTCTCIQFYLGNNLERLMTINFGLNYLGLRGRTPPPIPIPYPQPLRQICNNFTITLLLHNLYVMYAACNGMQSLLEIQDDDLHWLKRKRKDKLSLILSLSHSPKSAMPHDPFAKPQGGDTPPTIPREWGHFEVNQLLKLWWTFVNHSADFRPQNKDNHHL